MLKGFRDFVMKGNVLDLAVAVVIGAAFAAVIKAVVDGLINPLIAAVFGKASIGDTLTFTVNNATFSLGVVIDALIYFVAVAAVIYFLVIVPYTKVRERFAPQEEADARSDETKVLEEIRDLLRDQRGTSGA